ncbi:minor capsid protein [Listeria booriae]|uniref:minor capsid protein n=1 Tax=Listeria booriae TaxID=1552123 RepID=UPI001627E587|nr:minor capsid protein [Listeria booriae]MBC1888023.1 minor capsid protein [Listeria booriae]
MSKRIPKTRYPHNIEQSYAKSIVKLTEAIGEVVLHEFDNNIAPTLNSRNTSLDSLIEDSPFQKVLNRVKALTLGIFTAKEKYSIASRFVRATNSTAKTQFVNQMQVAGVNPTQTEPWLKEFMNTSVAENVSYISSISDEYAAKTEQIILRGIKKGASSKEVRDELVDQIGMTEKKAKFIARDQTGSLFGDLTKTRHIEAGIPGFMWSDSGDNRVRPLHVEYNGKYFSYDDPNAPIPGADYNCRCVAIPEFDETKLQGIKKEPGPVVKKVAKKEWSPPPPLDNLARYEDVNKMIAEQDWEEYDWDFFEASDINRYTGPDHSELNNYLRAKAKEIEKNTFNSKSINESLEEFDSSLSQALQKVETKRNMVVYRAVENDNFLKGIDTKKGITKFIDPGYVSTTPFTDSSFIDDKVLSRAAKLKKGDKSIRPYILIEIEVPAGTKGAYLESYSRYKDEKELLLNKNTVFEFAGDKYDDNTGIRTVRLQVVKQK